MLEEKVWLFEENWDSWSVRVKKMDLVNFQRGYMNLPRDYGFGDWKSSKGRFRDDVFRCF